MPPPEATLIRLVREAAHMTAAEAALAAGISKARWSQIENGYETRGDGFKEVRGKRDTIAHMAHALHISPERLEEAGRPDAAQVLREIQRQEVASQPVPAPSEEAEPAPHSEVLTPEEQQALANWREAVRLGVQQKLAGQQNDSHRNGSDVSA